MLLVRNIIKDDVTRKSSKDSFRPKIDIASKNCPVMIQKLNLSTPKNRTIQELPFSSKSMKNVGRDNNSSRLPSEQRKSSRTVKSAVDKSTLEIQLIKERRSFDVKRRKLLCLQTDVLENYKNLQKLQNSINHLMGKASCCSYLLGDLKLISFREKRDNKFLIDSRSTNESILDDQGKDDFTFAFQNDLQNISQTGFSLCKDFLKNFQVIKKNLQEGKIVSTDGASIFTALQSYFNEIEEGIREKEERQQSIIEKFLDNVRAFVEKKTAQLKNKEGRQDMTKRKEILLKLKRKDLPMIELKSNFENDLLESNQKSLTDVVDERNDINKNIESRTEHLEDEEQSVDDDRKEDLLNEINRQRSQIENLLGQISGQANELLRHKEIISDMQRVLFIRTDLINSLQQEEDFDKRRIDALSSELHLRKSIASRFDRDLAIKSENISSLTKQLERKERELLLKKNQLRRYHEYHKQLDFTE